MSPLQKSYARFFLGGDTAPSESKKSDEGALVTGVATPRVWPDKESDLSDNEEDWNLDFVHARVFNAKQKLSARQWSGVIHKQHKHFGYEKIVLDAGAGGGGIFVKRELIDKEQLINNIKTNVKPIADQVDGPRLVVRADFILHMFKRGDPGIELVWPNAEDSSKSLAGDELLKDAVHTDFKEALDHGQLATPGTYKQWREERRSELECLGEERDWTLKNITAGGKQIGNISVATREDGTHLFTKRGAHVFQSVGRDDIAMAMMYCYVAFRIWLKSDAWRTGIDEEDEGGFLMG